MFQGALAQLGGGGLVDKQFAFRGRFNQRELARQRGFAAARFAHHRQRFTGGQFKRHAVERFDHGAAFADAERHGIMAVQIIGFQYNGLAHAGAPEIGWALRAE